MISEEFYRKHRSMAVLALGRESRTKALERLAEHGIADSDAEALISRAMTDIAGENRRFGTKVFVTSAIVIVVSALASTYNGYFLISVLISSFIALAGAIDMAWPSKYKLRIDDDEE